MSAQRQMLEWMNSIDNTLEAALKLHGIEVAYDDLSTEQDEAWSELQSELNTVRGMIMAHVKER